MKSLLFLCLSLSIAGTGFAGVVHVKALADGAADGSSWDNAFPHLQDALAAAREGDEVWVAAGTYYPDRGTEQTPGDQLTWFTPKNGMFLYGGFAGNETSREQRDVDGNETILSGEIAVEEENWSRHVVRAHQVEGFLLDGFTITGGNAQETQNGGGLNLFNSSATVRNCRFIRNSGHLGGAIRSGSSSLVVIQTLFVENHGRLQGGAIHQDSSSLVVEDCSFSGNSSRFGGAIYAVFASVTIRNSTFTSNSADQEGDGGAIQNKRGVALQIEGSLFEDNEAQGNGGSIHSEDHAGAPVTISDSVFQRNFSRTSGGAILNESGFFRGDALMWIESSTFIRNSTGARGGAVANRSAGAIAIDDSTFTENSGSDGGAIANYHGSTMHVNRSVFRANAGWAIHNNPWPEETDDHTNPSFSYMEVRNSLFLDNNGAIVSSRPGGTRVDLKVINCTFRGNIIRGLGEMKVRNSILWSSAETSIVEPIQRGGGSETPFPEVTHNLIEGGYPGEGNISEDPLFVDIKNPAGPDEVFGTADDGLRLRARSPAIDAGNNDFVEEGETDLAGNPRIQGARVDLGAYESRPFAPFFVSDPQPVTSHPGARVTFSAQAIGVTPLTYQWYHNGLALESETAPQLTIDSVTTADAGRYILLVKTQAGNALSAPASLTVHPAPVLPYNSWISEFDLPSEEREEDANPAGDGLSNLLKYALGLDPTEPASFSFHRHLGVRFPYAREVANIELTPELSDDLISWESTHLGDYPFKEIALHKDGSYRILLWIKESFQEAPKRFIRIGVDRPELGGTTSDPAELPVEEVFSPKISAHPRETATHLGETATLSLTALGVEPLSYQWFRNGAPVEGATNPTLTLEALSLVEAGNYRALVTNEHGSAVSEAAHLTVHPVEALPYETWIANFSLPPQQREQEATPAGDGTPNVLKYVIGEDATQPVGDAVENRLVLSFDYAAHIVDVCFSIEISENGSTWESIPLDSYPHKMIVALECESYRAYVWFDESVEETLRTFIRLRAGR